MDGDMQSIGQSSSAEVDIVGILDWEACYQLTWWYFAAYYQYLPLLHHLESVIIANQKRRVFFCEMTAFQTKKHVTHSAVLICRSLLVQTYQRSFQALLRHIWRNMSSDNGFSMLRWNRGARNRSWDSIPPGQQSQGPERSASLFLHQPMLNCLVSCVLRSDICT